MYGIFSSDVTRVWVTKHVSHFCGTNRQLSRFYVSVANACPLVAVGWTRALLTLSDVRLLVARVIYSVHEFIGWLAEVETDETLLYMIIYYLLGLSTVKAASFVTASSSSYIVVARQLDLLGFDNNFVEGRIPTVLVDFHRSHYATITTHCTTERWAKVLVLIIRLLGMTHRQLVALSERSG